MVIALEELADFATLGAAAKAAGLARSRLNTLVLAGEVPALRFNGAWYVHRRDVDSLARRRAPYKAGLATKNREGIRRTLAVLAANDGATTRELMGLSDAAHRTTLGRLQFLEARGLVRREKNGGPKDPDRAYLTAEGRRYYREELLT